MNFPQHQRGMGVVGWLIMIAVFGSVITIGMKLVPLYTDHSTMSSILDGMATDASMSAKRSSEIEKIVKQRFKMNGIREFSVKDNVDVVRSDDGVQIVMDYEVRIPLIHNVDLIASFDKSVDLKD